MDKIECSVWNNGKKGWGLKVLGGPKVRRSYFDRAKSPVFVELDGTLFPCNIDKDSFWTKTCGELINVNLRNWITQNNLTHGDRVWLDILEPYRKFRAVRMEAAMKEIAS